MEKKFETTERLVYACGYCGKLHYLKEQADLCHNDKTCKTCGKVIGKIDYYSDCSECRNKAELEKEKDLFNKASKMTYDEYVNKFPSYPVFFNDKYYFELEDMDCDYEDEADMPKYVWGTYGEEIELDYMDIVQNFEERTNLEEFDTDRNGVKELKEFCKQWNEKYSQTVYWEDKKIAVML